MKKFILKTLLFVSPILVIALIMELLIRGIPNDYKLKKEYLDKHSNEIEILILGNSHSYYGLDPAFMEQHGFNAAYVSQSLDYDLKILKAYEGEWTNLKTIILPISYFSLLSNLGESWRVKNYKLYYGFSISSYLLTNNFEILANELKTNFLKLGYYYILRDEPITTSLLGWGTSYNSKNSKNLNITGKESALRHSKDGITLLKENVATLRSIVAFCETNNVRVVLFTPPAYYTYTNNLNQEQLDLTIETTIEIVNSYKNSVYFNLLNDSSFTSIDFYDGDHLNEIGAKKLSLLMKNLLEKENKSSIALK